MDMHWPARSETLVLDDGNKSLLGEWKLVHSLKMTMKLRAHESSSEDEPALMERSLLELRKVCH